MAVARARTPWGRGVNWPRVNMVLQFSNVLKPVIIQPRAFIFLEQADDSVCFIQCVVRIQLHISVVQ